MLAPAFFMLCFPHPFSFPSHVHTANAGELGAASRQRRLLYLESSFPSAPSALLVTLPISEPFSSTGGSFLGPPQPPLFRPPVDSSYLALFYLPPGSTDIHVISGRLLASMTLGGGHTCGQATSLPRLHHFRYMCPYSRAKCGRTSLMCGSS